MEICPQSPEPRRPSHTRFIWERSAKQQNMAGRSPISQTASRQLAETIPTSVTKENESNLEIINNPKEIMFALLTKGSVEKEIPRLQNVIQIDRFSSKLKLI